MNKKCLIFASLPLLLTACSHQSQAVKITANDENSWEHSTPQSVLKPLSETQIPQTGWVPIGNAHTQNSPDTDPLPATHFSPVEVKPIIQHRVVKDDIYTESIDLNPEVVRYDRYLLVENKPQAGQKYLLEQQATVKMKGLGLTVENGIWHTLNGTGYTLCSPINPSVSNLFSLSLPKVHYQFGPVRLRDALQMLAGEAFTLTVNDALRQVCYSPRLGDVPTKTPRKP